MTEALAARPSRTVPGPVLFARYAFPPNSHGFCGPGDHAAFFEYGVAGADDGGLRAMSQQFAGAWPYLELIAAATGLDGSRSTAGSSRRTGSAARAWTWSAPARSATRWRTGSGT